MFKCIVLDICRRRFLVKSMHGFQKYRYYGWKFLLGLHILEEVIYNCWTYSIEGHIEQ